MKVVYGKEPNREEISLIKNIASECGILFDTARLLYSRNIDTVNKVKEFLSPGKNHFNSPMLFNQMKSVVSRIDCARQNGETVLICGDYDADGICATTILYNCLTEYGVNTLYIIPEREGGYGLDLARIEEICSETVVDLIITVDCGISEREKIAELIDVGIDVIVTDHHEPPEILPDCLIINPKVKDSGYPFDGLSGAGVAYKLGCALIGGRADKFLDFVALATVADSMDLIGENRSLVHEGLKIFNSPRLRTAFKQLLGDGVNKQITSQTLAYSIAPRVNAGGRMGDANASLELFISENDREIFDLAVKLNTYNALRQTKCEEIYKNAKQIIKEKELYKKSAILVANEEWSTGFVGIVAAKLVEDYDKPVIVFAGHSGYYKGSARSIPEINVYNAISLAKDFLITFGGHSQAAGVSVEKNNFDIFYDKLCEIIDKQDYEVKKEKEIYVEWEVKDKFSLRFAKEINRLEPYGTGNKKPLFSIKENKILSYPLKSGSPHYVFTTKALDVLDFNGENNVYSLSLPINKNLIFEPNYSVFKGQEQVKGYLKQIVIEENDFSLVNYHVFRHEILNILTFSDKKTTLSKKEFNGFKSGYGIIYAVSSINSLNNYEIPNDFNINFFNVPSFEKKNCIVISPEEIHENFSELIYLDKPVYNPPKDGYIVSEKTDKAFKNLSTDRGVFAEIFAYLCSITNKKFFNSVETALSDDIPFDKYQFIFSTEVFLELKIFYIENGVLKRNINIKNPLTNSVVYNTICNITEGVCSTF